MKDAQAEYKEACTPSSSSRRRAYDVLIRVLMEDGTQWVSLPTGGYLHYHTINTQSPLKETVVLAAVSNALQAFHKSPDADVKEERNTLFNMIKKELRDQRATSSVSVKHVEKLPRSMVLEDVPEASNFVAETAKAWIDAKAQLAIAAADYTQRTAPLKKERDDVLNGEAREYLMGISGSGQPVALSGHSQKFKLCHTVSTRRNPIREIHVQKAVRSAVDKILIDEQSVVSADVMTQLIMSEALQLAGSETKDVFSLNAKRGCKRAAGDE